MDFINLSETLCLISCSVCTGSDILKDRIDNGGNMEAAAVLQAIEEMSRRIANRFKPHKVILFGSRARGADDADSDVDLLVVMDITGSKQQKEIEIRLALRGLGVAKDVVVVTPQEYEKYANVVGSIIYPAVREGKVLYERPA